MADFRLTLLAPAGRSREISGALAALARRARHDSACASSQAYAAVDDPTHLELHVEWQTDADLARYVRSDDFSQVLTLIEMAAASPIVEFRVGGETRDLSYAAEMRGTEAPTPNAAPLG